MASIDLSSKQWTDIVFDGRNTAFGAYQLRKESDKRHNLALIIMLGIMCLVALIVIGIDIITGEKPKDTALAAQARALVAAEQQQYVDLSELDIPVEEEENTLEQEEIKIEEEVVLQEEITNSLQYTDFTAASDEEEINQSLSQDDVTESETMLGNQSFDQGIDDYDPNAREHKDEVVVETKPVVEDNHVYDVVEEPASYPGGEQALYQTITNNLRYPQMAADNGVQGRVVVQFVVKKDGSVGEVRVVRSVDPDLDKEAIRVVKTLKKFTPGRQNGHPVNVWFTLPIQFKLANN